MTSQTIEVELGDREALADRVVAEAARQLLTQVGVSPDGDVYESQSSLARRVEAAVVDVIHEQAAALTPQIAQKVLAEGVQTTDGYGYAQGAKRPLGAVIAERVEQTLNGSRYGSTSKGLIEGLIKDEVERKLKGELAATLDEAKRKVMRAVSDEATNALRHAIEKALPEVTF